MDDAGRRAFLNAASHFTYRSDWFFGSHIPLVGVHKHPFSLIFSLPVRLGPQKPHLG